MESNFFRSSSLLIRRNTRGLASFFLRLFVVLLAVVFIFTTYLQHEIVLTKCILKHVNFYISCLLFHKPYLQLIVCFSSAKGINNKL